MRQDIEITNFTAGELSPKLKGRVDMKQYFNGADTLLNMVVLPQGGATKRPGTRLAAAAKNTSSIATPSRLQRFVFSTVQAYMLEFSAGNIRVYANGGVVVNGSTPVDITTPYAAGDLFTLKFTQSADTLYITHPNYPPATVTRSSNVSWSYAAMVLRDGPYLDTNTTTTTLSPTGVSGSIAINASSTTGINNGTGFLSTDVGRLLRIKLYSLWAWCLITAFNTTTQVVVTVQAKVNFGAAGAIDGAAWAAGTKYQTGEVVTNAGLYYQCSVAGISNTATGGTNYGPQGLGTQILDGTCEWSNVGAIDAQKHTQNTLYGVGDIVVNKQTGGSNNSYICIEAGQTASASDHEDPQGTGNNLADGTVLWAYLPPFVFPTTTVDWTLGRYGRAQGYPYAVRFWQERLCLGGYNGQPDELAASQSGDFTNMAPTTADGTVTDANALDWTIDDDEVNAIHWLATAGSAQAMQLGIGTDAGEHILQGANTSQALTPDSVQGYSETSYGSSSDVQPLRIGKALLFADRTGRKIREWAFYWQENGYLAPDLTQFSEHITRGPAGSDPAQNGIAWMAYQQAPHQVIWSGLNNGNLISATYDREEQVFAPSRHQLGGQYYGGPPIVEYGDVIPSQDGTYDELWLCVVRTIAGVPARTIEVMTRYFDAMAVDDAFFVDCGLSDTLTFPNAALTPPLLINAPPGNTVAGASPPRFIGTGVFVADADVFSGGSVGAVIRINGGKAVVTAFTDARHVTAQVLTALQSLAPAAADAWSCDAQQVSVSGLSYLNGETVGIIGDGANFGTAVVNAGAVSLTSPGASYRSAGLPYQPVFIGMPWEPSRAAAASSQGKMKRPETLYVRFHESIGCRFGRRLIDDMTQVQSDKLETMQSRNAGDLLNNVPPLFSGQKKLNPQGGYDREGQVMITQSEPLPLTVIGIFASGNVAEMPGT